MIRYLNTGGSPNNPRTAQPYGSNGSTTSLIGIPKRPTRHIATEVTPTSNGNVQIFREDRDGTRVAMAAAVAVTANNTDRQTFAYSGFSYSITFTNTNATAGTVLMRCIEEEGQ